MIAALALLATLALAQAPPTPADPLLDAIAEGPAADPALVERFAAAYRASDAEVPEEKVLAFATFLAQFESSLPYQDGHIELGDGLATVDTEGLRYLPPESAARIIEFWGNPPGAETLGMLVPAEGPLMPDSWAVILRFDDSGWVDDSDAAGMDYDALLKEMQESAKEESARREALGLDAMVLTGWAEPPHYDSPHKVLYWAKAFDGGSLNYDVRALGRRGVLSMVAVAEVRQLADIRAGMEKVRATVRFTEGNRYQDYDSNTDAASGYGLAALVAGGAAAGVVAKTGAAKGIFALLLASKKLIVIGVVAGGAALKGVFSKGSTPSDQA